MFDQVVDAVSGLAALLVFVGLVLLIKPFWIVRKRWQGALIAVGAFAVFSSLNQVPASKPAGISEVSWRQRLAICAAAQRWRACPRSDADVAAARLELASAKTKQVAASDGPAQAIEAKAGERGQDRAERASELKRVRAELEADTQPCDQAVLRAAHSRGRINQYNAAIQASSACRDAYLALGELHHSEVIPEEARKTLDEAIHCYALAYTGRAIAMDEVKGVLDVSDPRLSAVASAQGDLKDAIQRDRECAVQYVSAAAKYGLAGELFPEKAPHAGE